MVLFHFNSMQPFLKVVQHCFGILDGCCALHRRCYTLWILILWTAINVGPFRVSVAITCQKEAFYEFYRFDSFKPLMDSFIQKKDRPNLNRVMEVFYPTFFHHMDFYGKMGSPRLVFRFPSPDSGALWYHPFQIHPTISKSRSALFRHLAT